MLTRRIHWCILIYVLRGTPQREKTNKREWLSGGVSPCQGEGRGFESRLALVRTR